MTSMNQRAERQQGFFSVIAQRQTYRNLLYILIIVPLALLHAGLIALGGIVILSIAGVSLDWPVPFNVLGLLLIAPAFGIGLFVLAALLDMQSWVNHKLLGVDRIASPRESFSFANAIAWSRQRVVDRWLWSGLLYLLVIALLGAASAGFTLLFIGISVALLAGSVAGELSSVQIAIGTLDLQLPGLRLVMISLAPVVAIAGLHLANVMAGVAARVGSSLLGPYDRPPTAASSLSSMAETAYAHRGERVTSRGSW
jgi:hypothetical protein